MAPHQHRHPSYNQGQYIEETIRSILLQGYPDLEYFIMDGGSTDDSVEIIKKYVAWLAGWASESDRGQAHAINKGLKNATGHWFQFINSDDVVERNAFRVVGSVRKAADAVAGAVRDFGDGETVLRRNRRINAPQLLRWIGLNNRSDFHQPGIYLRRASLQAMGGFDECYRYTFDFKTIAAYLDHHSEIVHVDHTLSLFRVHALSKSSAEGNGFGEEFGRARSELKASGLSPKSFEACNAYSDELSWHQTVKRINEKENNTLTFTIKLVIAIAERPATRLNRFSLGAFKRRLFSNR